jgi:pyruvate/2-oxoglutarate dehydrogenase complex dihydrolipoamide dehydrogenase (E3) component
MAKTYDMIVIGAGPGGYVAAIRGRSWASRS